MVGPSAKLLPAWCAVLCMAMRTAVEIEDTQVSSLDVQRGKDAGERVKTAQQDDAAESCPADAHAVMALRKLGAQEGSRGPHHCNWPGIACQRCSVSSIRLLGMKHITGSIKELQHFAELNVLELGAAKICGDIKALANLTKLQNLSLSGTQVTGDISHLNKLVQLKKLQLDMTLVSGDVSHLNKLFQLKELRLDRTQVSGDISHLNKLVKLKELHLYRTQVSGDVSDLKRLTQLKALSLAQTKVSGTISDLKPLTLLTSLFLEYTRVSGDVSDLKALTRLKFLRLYHTQVSGDVSDLRALTQLQTLDLQGLQLSGNVSDLKALTQLTFLRLYETQVSGDVSDLKALVGLKWLSLGQTKVSGVVSDLNALTKLRRLYIYLTQVSGNVSHLKELTQLKRLHLDRTQVSGDVSDLNALHRLKVLSLYDTEVAGDISGLSALPQLQKLSLQKTHVTGNISNLSTVAGLRDLSLADTGVYGDLGVLTMLPNLTNVDLQRTSVSGRWMVSWRGCCRNLRRLLLSGSNASLLPEGGNLAGLRELWTPDLHPDGAFLPALTTLEVSGCPLRGSLQDLLLILAASPAVSRVVADGSNLTGSVRSERLERVHVNGETRNVWTSLLSQSLQNLEVSNNQISAVEALLPSTHLGLAWNGGPLRLANGLLQEALSKAVSVDLQGTSLTDASQPEHLLTNGALQITERIIMSDERRGIACRGLVSSTLQVSPDLFLPDRLCGCLAGWQGSGVSCRMCPPNWYSYVNSTNCAECPRNSTSSWGATSVQQCKCEFGMIYNPAAQVLTSTRQPDHSHGESHECGCVKGQAFHDDACSSCDDLHLSCKGPGFAAITAPAAMGWMRLKAETVQIFRCTDPQSRCKPDGPNGCAHGYAGPLCIMCAEGHYASGNICKECTASLQTGDIRKAIVIATAIIAAAVVMRRRCAEIGTAEPRNAALALLMAQGPMLLQLCQLWMVLAVLASSHHGLESKVEKDADHSFAHSFWEEPYIQWLQLSVQGLKDALSLDCSFGAAARLAVPVAASLVPLALLALCVAVELAFHSTGISMALRILTLFFVGGAAGCAKLLTCQDVDGGGRALSEELAFRLVMPDVKCSTSSWVDAVGCLCLLAYGVLIPLGLLTLMIKQHVALHAIKRIQPLIKEDDKLLIRLNEFGISHDKFAEKDQRFEKNLLAAAVSHITVLFRGKVRMQKEKGGMTLKFVDEGVLSDAASGDFGEMLELLEIQRSADAQKCTAIMRMLMERCVLEESASDRILTGAKELFNKYVWCQDVWVEMMMRLAAVALVSVVSVPRGLGLSVGITLGVGLMIGFMQPYAQRQVNHLQCCCFICLAVAAVGFGFKWIWLARAALVLPFLVSCVQLKNPDCPEALALRLFKALERQLAELSEGREFVVEELSF
ncbi:unnamed protein product [Effrenium voratum]|nr:unnamed protein product [Effrenium voratum]